jgi:protease IV
MKKVGGSRSRTIVIILVVLFLVLFMLIPISLILFNGSTVGNVAIIPIEGVIMGSGGSSFSQSIVNSQSIVELIKKADDNPSIKVILLEINSPGGSAVASDEIATAIKNTNKPTIALIREVGASGGYWVATATDHIIANRMSITGSIGVISSYLEFSGLMEEYGVSYQRLVAGNKKDIGTPLRKLSSKEEEILQKKLNKIHDYFIKEIAENRGLSVENVRKVATGEFYLGVEAKELNLIDQLGNKESVEKYIKETYSIEKITFVSYIQPTGFFDLFSGVFSKFFFNIGEGFGSKLMQNQNLLLM